MHDVDPIERCLGRNLFIVDLVFEAVLLDVELKVLDTTRFPARRFSQTLA